MEIYKTFNEEQKRAYCALTNFIDTIVFNKEHDKNDVLLFLLNGAGGCGKTYLIEHLISFIDDKINFKILAPTHKACSILENSMESVMTVSKFLGYKEDIDEDGNKIITYTPISSFSKNIDLLIIDECSMITKDQLNELKKTLKNILFIGDICQINPVREIVSDVFNCEFFDKAELVKNERIQNKTLAPIITDFRDSVMKGYLQKKCIVNDFRINSRQDFDEKLFESFRNDEDTIYIAWTNTSVNTYNNKIRKALFGENVFEYVIGESLIFSSYYTHSNLHRFYTSQRVKVSNVTINSYNIYNPMCSCERPQTLNDIIIKSSEPHNTTEKIKKCDKCHTPSSIYSSKKFDFYELEFAGYKNSIFLKPVCDIKEIYGIIYKHRDKCKLSKNKILWKTYYNMIDTINTPVSYSYAITVHKSQGSGYNNVYADLENIGWCNTTSEKLRLSYTAISRAKKSLHFIK